MQNNSLLSTVNLVKRFGGITAINNCCFDVEENTITGLIGPNGSGKTTLFNLITGVYAHDGGEIYFRGERISGLKPYKISQKGISRTFQIIRVFPKMTALENMVVVSQTGSDKENRERACKLLEDVGLINLKDEYAGNLSYGQQKLLEFARVLMTDPDLLLLDEPAAGVNPTMQKKLWKHIGELQHQGKTIIIIEHNMKVIMNLCEKIFVLDHGKKIAEGLPKDIQCNERVIEAYFGR